MSFKISNDKENPFDLTLTSLANTLNPFFKATGHTSASTFSTSAISPSFPCSSSFPISLTAAMAHLRAATAWSPASETSTITSPMSSSFFFSCSWSPCSTARSWTSSRCLSLPSLVA